MVKRQEDIIMQVKNPGLHQSKVAKVKQNVNIQLQSHGKRGASSPPEDGERKTKKNSSCLEK